MKWSLKLGRFAGIDVFLHWTFALLILWIFVGGLSAGQTASQALVGVAFVLALFACVVLHEFGHALVARRYGIGTRDITLLPIGGLARLERLPESPLQEFWVAVAGPAVNVAIAVVLYGWLRASGNLVGPSSDLASVPFAQRLMVVNLFLAAFNLLPAFPMDGGRVLRAILASRMDRHRATAIAANVGQAMAILLGLLGFLFNPFLIFIAIFVYLGAQGEASLTEMQAALRGLQVRDAMMTRFRVLAADAPLDQAVTELLAGSQQDFPVERDGRLLGVLRRNDLVKALAAGQRHLSVAEAMSGDGQSTTEDASLRAAMEGMQERQCGTLPVLRDEKIVGLLTLENIGEMLMVRSALAGRRPQLRTGESVAAAGGSRPPDRRVP